MSSSTGTIFRLTTFGESHGAAVGAVVDGCPSRLAICEADIQPQLDRRRPGQSPLTTQRGECDTVSILSGVENGITLGTPIALVVKNRDMRPEDYSTLSAVPRPSHADLSYRIKYGVASGSGGGRASARETVGRVAGGAIAEKLLWEKFGVRIVAWVSSVGGENSPERSDSPPSRAEVDSTPVRCPDATAARRMAELIESTAAAGDSVGGIVTCVALGVPAGWGEPVFDKLGALLASAMLSIPASRGFEIGAGFCAAGMNGSEHNDPFVSLDGRIVPATNLAGGVLGGISSGAPIVFRVAFKPPATIRLPQRTVDYDGRETVLEASGRHDPCVVPRAVPVVESMAALVLADAALMASVA